MVHIIIGTKAQFIKMAPVMKGLESRDISYNFINLGQHGATVESLSKQFGVRSSEFGAVGAIHELPLQRDIVSIPGLLKWLASYLITIAFREQHLKDIVFKNRGGIALIHGDTLSTFLGLLMAKRAGLKVAHIESGLRSWNYLHPFPEELIRVICMRYSDYLFAPSFEAEKNLKKMKVKGKVFNTGGNTGMDAVREVVSGQRSAVSNNHKAPATSHQPYVLVSIHRFENLYSKKRFKFILETVDEVSKRFNVMLVMHGPTEKKLSSEFGVQSPEFKNSKLKTQNSKRIVYLPLQDYPTFLHLIRDAEFVITDGGSVQEECYYLGKPCLIMRKRTERAEGIGENAVLSGFNEGAIGEFTAHYRKYEMSQKGAEMSPSVLLIDQIMKYV
jgi:UDP-N-acetylglucosamine 2-epimerase (non-hydrolysing)